MAQQTATTARLPKTTVLKFALEGHRTYNLDDPQTLAEAAQAFKDMKAKAEELGFKLTHAKQSVGTV